MIAANPVQPVAHDGMITVMKILQLTAENLKRLKAVQITPEGAMVQITGKNGAGKSSVLDSIAYAIGGKDAVCAKPVRKGQQQAKVTCKLDGLTVMRTFTPDGGGSLIVTAADGDKVARPQDVLDRLVGQLTLDPLEFIRLAPKKQAEMLRNLVGLDFTDLDKERESTYAERTLVNNAGKSLRAQVDALPHHADAPAQEVSVSELVTELQKADKANGARRTEETILAGWQSAAKTMEKEIAEVETRLAQLKRDLTQANGQAASMSAALAKMPVVDTGPLKQKISGSESTNRKVRDNTQHALMTKQLEGLRVKSQTMTDRLSVIEQEKKDKLAKARFPVPGLSFDEEGVTYTGIPFDQASSAEQLRVSVAIGLALNPKLRVLLIRDGSLLDKDGLGALALLAVEHSAQVWIETVSNGENVGVVIEDGMVKATEAP